MAHARMQGCRCRSHACLARLVSRRSSIVRAFANGLRACVHGWIVAHMMPLQACLLVTLICICEGCTAPCCLAPSQYLAVPTLQ